MGGLSKNKARICWYINVVRTIIILYKKGHNIYKKGGGLWDKDSRKLGCELHYWFKAEKWIDYVVMQLCQVMIAGQRPWNEAARPAQSAKELPGREGGELVCIGSF